MIPITHVSGETSEAGDRIVLRFQDAEDREIEVVLARSDVQPLVSLLIALGGQALHRSGDSAGGDHDRVRPFPVSAMTIAEGQGSEPVLVLDVGATAFGFMLEPAQLEMLGRAALTLSATGDGAPH